MKKFIRSFHRFNPILSHLSVFVPRNRQGRCGDVFALRQRRLLEPGRASAGSPAAFGIPTVLEKMKELTTLTTKS